MFTKDTSMRRARLIACAGFVVMTLLTGKSTLVRAQTQPISSSAQNMTAQDMTARDTKAIETILHSNPSDHFAEDGSFTNIFGTVRYGREEFRKRHAEIAQTIFKGTSVKSSIGKLRFVRPDVAIVDVTGEMTGFAKVPAGLPVGPDGVLRFKLLEVLVKEKGEWWITEYHNVAVTPEL
jgi:uncharacterized protein (TIGR02246 family)